jgi:4-aminobutyrate aminotransferase-like enzyme
LPGPKTKAILQRGIKYLRHGRSYEEDSTIAKNKGSLPPAQLLVAKAKGDYVWDHDGNKFIDFQNGWATNPLGNCHPEIIEAVYGAMKQYGYQWEHPLRFELAEKLLETMPGQELCRASFEVSGTEAVEAAIHMALCHKKARYVIGFTSSFHGESLGAKVISGYNGENNLYMEAWSGGVIKAPYPYTENIPAGMTSEQYVKYCLWFLEEHIPRYITPIENVAAVLIEPGLAEGGNWIPSVKFLQGIRKICDRYGWLLIIDEVLTGLGRTGKMWAVEHYNVTPDILIAGKSLSGGIEPCAAVTATDEILGNNRRATSGSTFAGTPTGCAAALKTLEIYKRDRILDNVLKLGAIARKHMAEWAEKYEIVGEVRTNGLLMGVSFKSPDSNSSNSPACRSTGYHIARAVRNHMMNNGVFAICIAVPVIRFYPALNMAEETLIEGLTIMEESIAYIEKHGSRIDFYPPLPTGNVGF